MVWRLAKSLDRLRTQVNEAFPKRRKDSDGTIGDDNHSKRDSDHNPWVGPGVVTALDLTHDPKNGFDSYHFAQALVDSKDPRIKYIISNGKIVSGTGQGNPAWVWRGYGGKNPHVHHVHVSVKSDQGAYDNDAVWRFDWRKKNLAPTKSYVEPPPRLRYGDTGDDVKKLQDLLSARPGYTLAGDGYFGPATQAAVEKFQEENDLVVDGIVGPQTWQLLAAKRK